MRSYMALGPTKKSLVKKEKNLKDAPMPPLPFARHIVSKADESPSSKEVERIVHKEGNLTLKEASILLKDMEEKGKKLKEKLDNLYRLRGASPEFIAGYIRNPSNFSPEQWEALNQKRRELVDSLNLPPELAEQAERFVSGQPGRVSTPSRKPSKTASSVEDKPKDRRKLSGARRGWLPMR